MRSYQLILRFGVCPLRQISSNQINGQEQQKVYASINSLILSSQ
jgi:hypothetical protein